MSIPSHYLEQCHRAIYRDGNWSNISALPNQDIALALVAKVVTFGQTTYSARECAIDPFVKKFLGKIGTTPGELDEADLKVAVSIQKENVRGKTKNEIFPSQTFLQDASNYLLHNTGVRQSMKRAKEFVCNLVDAQKWTALYTGIGIASFTSRHVQAMPLWGQVLLASIEVYGGISTIRGARKTARYAMGELEDVAAPGVIQAWARAADECADYKLTLRDAHWRLRRLPGGEQPTYCKDKIEDVSKVTTEVLRYFRETTTGNPHRNYMRGYMLEIRPSGPMLAGTYMTIRVFEARALQSCFLPGISPSNLELT